jgi:hypothetical protein
VPWWSRDSKDEYEEAASKALDSFDPQNFEDVRDWFLDHAAVLLMADELVRGLVDLENTSGTFLSRNYDCYDDHVRDRDRLQYLAERWSHAGRTRFNIQNNLVNSYAHFRFFTRYQDTFRVELPKLGLFFFKPAFEESIYGQVMDKALLTKLRLYS